MNKSGEKGLANDILTGYLEPIIYRSAWMFEGGSFATISNIYPVSMLVNTICNGFYFVFESEIDEDYIDFEHEDY